MSTIWARIDTFPAYAVSNDGRVMRIRNSYMNQSKAGRILKPIACVGYWTVNLRHNKSHKVVYIHRLVAEHFVPNPENKPHVNHIDGNRKNPHFQNLEWVTPKENTQHAVASGRVYGRPRTLTVKKMNKARRLWAAGISQRKISKMIGISQQSVSRILANKAWKPQMETITKIPNVTGTSVPFTVPRVNRTVHQ